MSKHTKPPKEKHIPQRTCVICRETSPKRELTRIVKTPSGEIQIDLTGKQAGRGAYICNKETCWHQAVESSVLEKALRTTFSQEDRERLIMRQSD